MSLTRRDVLRKCIIVFDAIKRESSKGNAGLEPVKGAEESFQTDCEICDVLREWLREMEAGEKTKEPEMEDWQKVTMAYRAPEKRYWQNVTMAYGAPEKLDFDEK